jgi:hypothetical protein
VLPDAFTAEDPMNYETPSHETLCFTNTCETQALVDIHFIYEYGRSAITLKEYKVEPLSSNHLRLDWSDRMKGIQLPKGVPYSIVIESNLDIVVMYSRLNWINGCPTTFATMCYFED